MPLHVSNTRAHHQEVKIALHSQVWWYQGLCSKHVEAWNKLIVKQKFCAWSWLITKINILRCRVSKTSQQEYCRPLVYKKKLHSPIKTYYSPTNAQVVVLKTVLKFTLKYLRHVSVQSHHLQGTHYPCLLKLHFVKIVNYGSSVYD